MTAMTCIKPLRAAPPDMDALRSHVRTGRLAAISTAVAQTNARPAGRDHYIDASRKHMQTAIIVRRHGVNTPSNK